MIKPNVGTWTLELITSQRAEKMLADKAPNRRIRESGLEALTRALEAGTFETTHEGIAFNPDGQLVDGQTRLTAIVNTGVSAWIWVYRGLRSAMNVNLGSSRSSSDAITISGVHATRAEVATLKRMLMSCNSEPVWVRFATNEQLRKWFELYSDAIRTAYKMGLNCNKKGITSVAVVAPVARATFTQDPVRLREFVECFISGVISNGEDIAAIKLRDLFLRGHISGSAGHVARAEAYAKVEYALDAFLKRREISQIRLAHGELFAIPNDPALSREVGVAQ